MTKLSPAQVAEIRESLSEGVLSQSAVGDRFGVSQATVSFIRTGKVHVAKHKGPVPKGYITDEGRECSKCGEFKLWKAFSRNPRAAKTGHQSACRECRRGVYTTKHLPQAHRKWLFDRLNITEEQYLWMYHLYEGNCWLHGGPEIQLDWRSKKPRWLCVDHDHSCCPPMRGCVRCIRGLLCYSCNTMVGLAEKVGSPVSDRFSDYLALRPLLVKGGGAGLNGDGGNSQS